ncbi:TerD family protein [Actinocorallia populi]|uniref:TerD family protein n=1 Tax=Actinocorallia populi TaxID=2079200 RepID=UPI000D0937F5|nr:TerD family protein [Actinocorallia populi]
MSDLVELIVRKARRLPRPEGGTGESEVVVRQFDAVLMSVGFKLSREAMERLAGRDEGTVIDFAVRVLAAVRREVGDHVRHNAYFKDFPAGVPDTMEFWTRCLTETLLDPALVERDGIDGDGLNLLALPSYGRYLHTYEEMLAAHDELIPSAGDRVTLLHLGGTLEEEASRLYLALAGSTVPLGEGDTEALRLLASHCADGPQPAAIPVREHRAYVNQVRMASGKELLADTVTDVLRLAFVLSGGSADLEPTRLRSPSRRERKALLAALDAIVAASPAKLGDVNAHQEQWKRLGERLHPHEYPRWPHAARVFAVARGEERAPSFAARVQTAVDARDVLRAVKALTAAPGLLFRSLDWLVRSAATEEEAHAILEAVESTAEHVSGRVLLSLREHLVNRIASRGGHRIFVNRESKAWTAPDGRAPLDKSLAWRLCEILDAEVTRRLPEVEHLVIDREIWSVALPLSGKSSPSGFEVLPRGSFSLVEGKLLRFFIYWRQHEEDTDLDLSALLLNDDYTYGSQLSWTELTGVGGEHSGDITSAEDGASEFINLTLAKLRHRVIIPQVLVYSGEGFNELAESFFGFMTRDADQAGAPFEPATVRMKSDLRGSGRVALPLVFLRGEDGEWRAKWLHIFLRGEPRFNRVETTGSTAVPLVRAIVDREYLRVRHLTDLWATKAAKVTFLGEDDLPSTPVTFVGREHPEALPEGSQVFDLTRLTDLIPS